MIKIKITTKTMINIIINIIKTENKKIINKTIKNYYLLKYLT